MKKICLVLMLCGLISASALCQEHTRPLMPKDEATAFRKSFMWTFIPVTIGGGLVLKGVQGNMHGNAQIAFIAAGASVGGLGLLIGPAVGHIYAERPHPMSGMGLRILAGVIGGAGTAGVGIAASFGDTDLSAIIPIATVTGAVIMASAIYDIGTAGRSARRYNERNGLANWHLQPQYFAQQEAMGLKLSVSF